MPDPGAVNGHRPDDPDAVVRAGDPVPPEEVLACFVGEIRYEPIRAEQTVYRDLGAGMTPAGTYWTSEPAPSEAAFRGGLGVPSTWNGGGGVVAFTTAADVPAWRGTAAPQLAAGSTTAAPTHLPGGVELIIVAPADAATAAEGDPGQWTIGPGAW